MSSATKKLGLHKISLTDAPPDITVLNQNWDRLDALTPADVGAMAEYAPVSTDCNADITANDGKITIRKYDINTLNTPYKAGATTFSIGVVITYACSGTYGTQVAFTGWTVYSRRFADGDYSPWKELATTDYVKALTPADIGAVKKTGDTMTGPLRIKNNANSTSGVRLNASSNNGVVLMDQSDIADDSSDRTGIKIMNDSDTINNMAQLFRTVDGVTTWYQLYGKHNTTLNLKLYSSLSDIGLSTGSETIDSIATNLPNNSILVIGITTSNATIYPSNYGLLTVKRTSATRIEFGFVNTVGASYQAFYSITSNGNAWTDWKQLATTENAILKIDKPSGSYTGNGDATSRTIDTFGTGSVVLIRGGSLGAILAYNGGLAWDTSAGNTKVFSASAANFRNGVITLATSSYYLNSGSVTYYYQVL